MLHLSLRSILMFTVESGNVWVTQLLYSTSECWNLQCLSPISVPRGKHPRSTYWPIVLLSHRTVRISVWNWTAIYFLLCVVGIALFRRIVCSVNVASVELIEHVQLCACIHVCYALLFNQRMHSGVIGRGLLEVVLNLSRSQYFTMQLVLRHAHPHTRTYAAQFYSTNIDSQLKKSKL